MAKATAQEKLLRDAASRINHHVAKGVIDENGRFRVPYIPVKRYALRMRVTAGTGANRRTGEFILDCDPDREQELIEVRLVR